jgi:membrane protein
MKPTSAWKGVQLVIRKWSDAEVNTYAAAVGYYTVFALAPLLLIIISIGGIIFDTTLVRQQVLAQFEEVFGPSTATFINSLLEKNISTGDSVTILGVGFIFVFIAAMGVFSALQKGLNRVFEATMAEKGVWHFISKQIISVSMVFLLGFAVLVSLTASTLLTYFGNVIDLYLPKGIAIAFFFELGVSFILITSLLACMIKYLPSCHISWKIAGTAAIIATTFFMVGKYALGFYLGSLGIENTYGVASSIIAFMLWSFYLAQVFFVSVIISQTLFDGQK